MNELVARNVVLVRAIETVDQNREILSDDDRRYASRSAKELAQWQASDNRSDVTVDYFLQHRSEQILKRIGERFPSFIAFHQRRSDFRKLSIALPALALLAGVLLDRIADPHRVDLLSAPLLLIIGWNLLAYVGLLVWAGLSVFSERKPGSGLVSLLSRGQPAMPRKIPSVLSNALFAFMTEWTVLSRRLTAARLHRTIHLSAALFAVGAILSLYARGFLTEYLVGWESTFLTAEQVHAALSILFAPAMVVFNLQGFSIADIEALRFSPEQSSAGGARWVHLYAATLLLLVVLPRMLLAFLSHWQAVRIAKNFPLDLDQPYFRKLYQVLDATPGILRVLPYSFTVDESRDNGLTIIARALLGEQARVMLRPSVPFGESPQDALGDTLLDDPNVALTAVLFSLAATPEKEIHGALMTYVMRESKRGIAALIDESAYVERMGTQAGSAMRIAERRALWQQFCDYHQVPATIVNLVNPDTKMLDNGIITSKMHTQ